MNRTETRTGFQGVLVVLLLSGVIGCAAYYREGPPVYRSEYYHYPYHYHYYPSTRVYFHISSGHYYYRDGDHWKRSRDLPPRHRLDRHDRVRLWIKDDKPYSRHKVHRDKFWTKSQYQRDESRDREERHYNRKRHERYRDR